MENNVILPPDLKTIVDSEKVDFSIRSKRNDTLKNALFYIFAGILVTVIISFLLNHMIRPVLTGGEYHMKVNGVDTTSTSTDFMRMVVPVCLLLLFLYAGIKLFIMGLKIIFQTGGYYIGTPQRMIRYYKGKVNSYDWEQFSGVITTKSKSGQITLDLKTGKMEAKKNKGNVFVPDTLFMSGLKNVSEIERICTMRIKENAPNS